MKKILITSIFALIAFSSFGQVKSHPLKGEKPENGIVKENILSTQPNITNAVNPLTSFSTKQINSISFIQRPQSKELGLRVLTVDKNNTPIFVKGSIENEDPDFRKAVFQYLDLISADLRIDNPILEFKILSTSKDKWGGEHLKLQQVFEGVDVAFSQLTIHKNHGKIRSLTGRIMGSPKVSFDWNITEDEVRVIVLNDLRKNDNYRQITNADLKLIGGSQIEIQKVIYSENLNREEALSAYKVNVYSNITQKYEFLIDASNGIVISKSNQVCKFDATPLDGVTNSHGLDLSGVNRNFKTYQVGGQHYMIDASLIMFNSVQSSLPNDPVGVVWTIDAQNTSPENSNFSYDHLKNNSTNWNNPTAVSAHYNAGVAYNYYKNTHSRNSINGTGGNIISLVNVSDQNGDGMDNAFWNGAAMFYGNGNQAFSPLAEALDVAGHELTHGVVQSTANLQYQGQSGALNESFADIFGCMMDSEDWKMGEDIVFTSVFPSGALRDLSNPHNGGNSLSDPGYQPSHMNEIYTGSQDNGGVHINSGIPNHAYYLFAEDIGKVKAEQVYYSVLKDYLTSSAKFIDERLAVIEVCTQAYGASSAEVSAAANAFAAVGIGEGSGTPPPDDITVNTGERYVIATSGNLVGINLYTENGEFIGQLTDQSIISKPSITDNGERAVYIAGDYTMWEIVFDWSEGTYGLYQIQSQEIWQNVAISKDGNRIAAAYNFEDNHIAIYDFGLEEWKDGDYELFNPTFAEGQTTGDVKYPDALEWDFSGNYVMYDAYNSIAGTFGGEINYWDVGFIHVWNNSSWGDGSVSKLFTQLPDDVSIGNPAFSKNSDYIVAFDYIDNYNEEYYILAANIETGDVGTIYQNGRLSYPNYSIDDSKMMFDAFYTGGGDLLATIDLEENKIESVSNSEAALISDAIRGNYFATGDRVLDVDNIDPQHLGLKVYPNPAVSSFFIEVDLENSSDGKVILFDLYGKKVLSKAVFLNAGGNRIEVKTTAMNDGAYLYKFVSDDAISIGKIIIKK